MCTEKTARGSSFTAAEDEKMAKAWVRVSEDAVIGSDQKGESFFRAIQELYNETKPSYCQVRTTESVKKRVKMILKDCLMFAACVARVNNNQPSGTNHVDCIHLATALYNKLEISSVSEDCGPTFKFMSSWEILKDHPKFELLNQAKKAPTRDEEAGASNKEENSTGPGEEGEEFCRPIGRKRAKVVDSRTEVEYKKLKLAEATLAAQTERNDLMRNHQEMLLFTSSTDDSDPIAMQYMSIMRKKALDRLLAFETQETPSNTDLSSSAAQPPN